VSSLRQLGSGLFYALVSVVLVVGGLSLALAEGSVKPAPPPTAQPSFTIPPPTATVPPPSPTSAIPPTATPRVFIATATQSLPSPTAAVTRRATPTFRAYPSTFSCGPYAGWIRAYTVQPGDTLFHISTLYRTTVTALQTANCKSTSIIFPGDRLWVPKVPTITPGLTFIPTFETSTAVPTEPLTLTPPPSFPTETAAPTDTSNPNP
jgi:hypothetical protein